MDKEFIEDAEFGLDSRYKSQKERELESQLLNASRLKKMKKLSEEEINETKNIQLI